MLGNSIRVVGLYVHRLETVVDEADLLVFDGEPNLPETLRGVLLERLIHSNGETDPNYQYVCALNRRGEIISLVDQIDTQEDGEPYSADYQLVVDPQGDTFQVVQIRLRNDSCLQGKVQAGSARAAGEAAIAYAHQCFGVASDCEFVAVIAPGGEITIVAENWGP